MNATAIKPGDKVRSYDFVCHDLEGPHACYVEGEVVATNEWMEDCYRYVIKVERQVAGGEEVTNLVGLNVYPPMNGTPTWLGGWTQFVEKM